MALTVHHTYPKNNTILTLWRATESTEELFVLAKLSAADLLIFDKIHLDKRRREWLCVKILLSQFAKEESLRNLSNGKPMISGGRHISVSHDGEIAGVIFSDQNIGMDIQTPHEKLLRIAPKFCSEIELSFVKSHIHELEALTMIWSAKEAVFKFFGERVHFAKDMRTVPFELSDEKLYVEYNGIHGSKTFELSHLILNDFHILHTN